MKLIVDYIPLVSIVLTAVLGYFINRRLENEKDRKNRKREVYESFLNAITLILFENSSELLIDLSQDYVSTDVNKIRLDAIKNYEKIKLWGSEGVIRACFDLFQRNIDSEKNSISQDMMKEPYYRLINEMRKDLGMKTEFNIDENIIQIIKFDRIDLFKPPR